MAESTNEREVHQARKVKILLYKGGAKNLQISKYMDQSPLDIYRQSYTSNAELP